jgi:hypothetical protein
VAIAVAVDGLEAVQHLEVMIDMNGAGVSDPVLLAFEKDRQGVATRLVGHAKQTDLVRGDLVAQRETGDFHGHALCTERLRSVV